MRLLAIKFAFLISGALFLCAIADAQTYWVSPTGAASWSSCAGSTPLSGTSACSLSTANSNAASGDLVYLRAGTYSSVGIAPSNSGTGSSLPSTFIIFQAYTGETPTIALSSGYPINLGSINYVRINGITVTVGTNTYQSALLSGGSHNEIENCTFNSTDGYATSFYVATLATVSGTQGATYNWIHNNTFNTSGQAQGTGGVGCTDGGGDVFNIGHGYSSSYPYEVDDHNTVENNVFNHDPHAAIDSYGMYTVIRNNVFHNEPWSLASAACTSSATYPSTYSTSNPNYSSYNGYYGHRDFQITEDYGRTATYQLVEGNRAGYAGTNQANGGADDFDLAAPQNIVRYNFFYGAMNLGLRLKYGWGGGLGSGGNGGTYNRIYNNTIYQNGYGYPYADSYPTPCDTSSCPWGQSSIGSENSNGNVVKNNILYLSNSYTLRGWDVDAEGAPSNGWSDLAYAMNNWCSGPQTGGDTDQNGDTGCSATGNPNFNDPDLSNTSSTTLPDLTLQSGSPAIYAASYLTTATNSGTSSTTLTVADALYFQDGTWGSDLAKLSAGLGGTFQADWIAIGSAANVVQISSVTYGTYGNPAGTITLASPMTWSNGAHIWLYKKSDGTIVLNGSEPSYGAADSEASGPTPTGSLSPGVSISGGTCCGVKE